MGLFGRKRNQHKGFPLVELRGLLAEYGPFVEMVEGEPSPSVSDWVSPSSTLRVRLTPRLDMAFVTTTEGVIVGFRDFGQEVSDDMPCRTVEELLQGAMPASDHPVVLLMVIGAHRYKYASGADQGFGNDELQHMCLESMGKASIGLAQALSRGESGIDLEGASAARAALFPARPVGDISTPAQRLMHHSYVTSSLAHLGLGNELLNDANNWSYRHWLSPTLSCELRESRDGYEWVIFHRSATNTSAGLQVLDGLTTPVDGTTASSAFSTFTQDVLRKISELPWDVVAGGMFEEMAGILVETDQRRTRSLVSLLEKNASDSEFRRFGESTFETWDGD